MNNLTKHDLQAHWWRIVMLFGHWAANCGDFELMHKWALKQFVRVVPHGKFFQAHLARRHLAQFAFEAEAPAAPKEEPLRFCHCAECKAQPGFHDVHVHVKMPGLSEEDDEGMQHVVARSTKRTVLELDVTALYADFQRALRRLMGEVQGVPMRQALLPETVCRSTRMKLLWHGADGKMQCCDTFHSAEEYHGGPWHDALMGRHKVVTTGPARCYLSYVQHSPVILD